MSKIANYIKESFTELSQKVSWPTWNELQESSIIVLIASFIFAIVIFVMDSAFGNLLELIYTKIFN